MSTKLSRMDEIISGDMFAMASSNNSDYRLASLTTVLNWIKSSFSDPDPAEQIITPADGFNATVNQNGTSTRLILLPTASLLTGTITLPINTVAVDGQEVVVTNSLQIASLTIAGNGATNVYGAPTVLAAEDNFTLKFNKTTNSWYKVA